MYEERFVDVATYVCRILDQIPASPTSPMYVDWGRFWGVSALSSPTRAAGKKLRTATPAFFAPGLLQNHRFSHVPKKRGTRVVQWNKYREGNPSSTTPSSYFKSLIVHGKKKKNLPNKTNRLWLKIATFWIVRCRLYVLDFGSTVTKWVCKTRLSG